MDAADFADGGDGALRLDHQPDDLHDAAARLRDARAAHPLQGGLEPVDLAGLGGFHAVRDSRNCSSLVSRRASRTPKRVWTKQPPRVTSLQGRNFKGPVSGNPFNKGD